jgi:hypothetical protein
VLDTALWRRSGNQRITPEHVSASSFVPGPDGAVSGMAGEILVPPPPVDITTLSFSSAAAATIPARNSAGNEEGDGYGEAASVPDAELLCPYSIANDHCAAPGFHHGFCRVRVRSIGLRLLYGARFLIEISTLEVCHWSCTLPLRLKLVHTYIQPMAYHLGCSFQIPVGTVISVKTLKARRGKGVTDSPCILPCHHTGDVIHHH